MQNKERVDRKERVGVVISDKMDKTITVKVDRIYKHPLYAKPIKTASKFKAHDEKNEAKMGDTVRISETRPLSKTKCWRLVEIVKKGAFGDSVEQLEAKEPKKKREPKKKE